MTKIIAAAALAMMMAAPSHFPADARVRIEEVHWQKHLLLYSGEGKGNVRDAQGEHGFDFVFEHCPQFDATHGPGMSMAYWTAPQRLTVLLNEIGGTAVRKCELRVTERDFIYQHHEGRLTTAPLP